MLLYYATSKENAESIKRDGFLLSLSKVLESFTALTVAVTIPHSFAISSFEMLALAEIV